MKEYDGAYFVFGVKCVALSLMNVNQMVAMIQIGYADKNSLCNFIAL
jgi:hypothetical protein